MSRVLTRCLIVASIFITVFALMSSSIWAQDLSVTVVRQAGKVEVKVKGEKDWQASKPDLKLRSGDLIRTLKGGKVQLLFPGDALVLIKENSLLDLKALAESGGKVKAITGDFLFNLQQALSPGSSFEVESPGALAVVRGTIWAQFIQFDGSLLLVSFDNDVELTAGGVTVVVPEGYESKVEPGGTPSEPTPTDLTLDEVENGFRIETGESVAEANMALEAWLIELLRLESDVSLAYREFLDYSAAFNEVGILLIYREVPGWRDALEQLSAPILSKMEPTDGSTPPVSDVPFSLNEVKGIIRHITDMLDEIESTMERKDPNPQETIDNFAALLPEDDPSLGIRRGQLDSDGDGMSDVLEITLGLDPYLDNTGQGFINAIAPLDGQVFGWPADQVIEFRFEPINNPLVANYRVWIESGGIQYTFPFGGDSAVISIEALLDPGQGGFAPLFDTTNQVNFTWYVTGELTSSMVDLGGDKIPSQSLTQLLASSRHNFDVRLSDGGTALLRVAPNAAVVRSDDILRVDLWLDTQAMIQDVTIRLRFDPTILEFDAGRTGAFWQNSVLFFGDTTPGEIAVSGRVNRDTGFIQGAGVLCQLDFRVRGQAGTMSPLNIMEAVFFGPGATEVSVMREDAIIEVAE